MPGPVSLTRITACSGKPGASGGNSKLDPWRANALDLRCVAFEVRLPGLPSSFDGYRLLHLSDTHLDVLPELVPVVHGLLDGAEVDLLAV